MQSAECRVQSAECGVQSAECRVRNDRHGSFVIGHWPRAGNRQRGTENAPEAGRLGGEETAKMADGGRRLGFGIQKSGTGGGNRGGGRKSRAATGMAGQTLAPGTARLPRIISSTSWAISADFFAAACRAAAISARRLDTMPTILRCTSRGASGIGKS